MSCDVLVKSSQRIFIYEPSRRSGKPCASRSQTPDCFSSFLCSSPPTALTSPLAGSAELDRDSGVKGPSRPRPLTALAECGTAMFRPTSWSFPRRRAGGLGGQHVSERLRRRRTGRATVGVHPERLSPKL